jgi:hypothetical protein
VPSAVTFRVRWAPVRGKPLGRDLKVISTDHGETEDRRFVETRQPEPLQSGVLSSPADGMLSRAITEALKAPPADRARLFSRLVLRIEEYMTQHPEERPWTCRAYFGTDGSSIFRGGIGLSIVIDPEGRLWRARSYEDFETSYVFVGTSCEIDTLTPLYAGMREYLRL